MWGGGGTRSFTNTLAPQSARSAPENDATQSWYDPDVSNVMSTTIRRAETLDECVPLAPFEL